jgi:S1-C subfamily serine protease
VQEAGDLNVAINGQPIDNVEDFERVVRDLKPGEEARVKFVRATKEMEATLVVDGV